MTRLRRWAPFVVLVVLASACGTRLTDQEIERAAYGSGAGSAGEAALAGPGADGNDLVAENGGDAATATTVGSATSGGSAGGDTASAASVGGGGAPAPSGQPIVLGQIGTFSGILGSGLIGLKQSVQAWVASVNAKGGINGHPVKLISKDDGGDGAKGLAEVKDMVENQKVVAFVGSALINSGRAIRSYLEERRIPVVGGDVYDQFWHESPMLFPQAEYINNLHYATAAGPIEAGKKSFSLMWCAEVPACGAAVPHWESSIAKLGGKVVYKAQVSIAAPDYTAQCVQSRQSGADVLWVGADGSTLTRIANSCARQGYHPTFTGAAGTLQVDFASNPNLQGFRGASQVFPWFMTSGNPALEEYGAMMKRHAPNAQLQPSTAQGWAAGKLFEKAVAGTIEAGQPPTSDAILRGLWTIKNETLGGLTSSLTYVANQPAVRGDCSYIVVIDRGKWVAPNGLELTCGTP